MKKRLWTLVLMALLSCCGSVCGTSGPVYAEAEGTPADQEAPPAKSEAGDRSGTYGSWYENGRSQGLYVNPELAHTVGYKFQNETIADIITMSEDPTLTANGWTTDRFFAGTIYQGLTVEELKALDAEGIVYLNEIQNQIPVSLALDSSSILSASKSKWITSFKMSCYDDYHGALYEMMIGGNVAFCLDYGRHSPDGATYSRIATESKLNSTQIDNVKKGILFGLWAWNAKDQGRDWGVDALEANSSGTYYLLSQAWIWAAMAGLNTDGCVNQVKLTLKSLYGSSSTNYKNFTSWLDEFMNNGYYNTYSFNMAVYSSGDTDNQDMVAFDISSMEAAKTLGVGVHKTGLNTGGNISGAVYGVYADTACTTLVTTITTGSDGRGSAVWARTASYGAQYYYLKELTAPAGTILNSSVHAVYVAAGSASSVSYVNTYNAEIYGNIFVTLTDSATGMPLPGASFALDIWNGNSYVRSLYLTDQGNGTYTAYGYFYTTTNLGRFRVVQVSAPEGYRNDGWSQTDTVTQSGQSMQYAVSNASLKRSLVLSKRILASDINFAHGDPTFLFKLEGTDIYGNSHVYYRLVSFDADYVAANTGEDGYVSKSVSFTDLIAGEYLAEEEDTSRYCLSGITDPVCGTVSGGQVRFDLVNGAAGSAVFTNRKYEHQDYSDAGYVINTLGNGIS